MPQEVRMPALGQTSDELRIISWLKREGEPVSIGEPLLEVETDKATLTVESAFSGTVLKIERHPGETVEAGTVIAYLLTPGEDGASNGSQMPANRVDVGDGAHPVLRGALVKPHSASVLASPVARRLAREHGIDIAAVRGSGPDGRIERKDIEAMLGQATRSEVISEIPQAQDQPVPRHRQALAQRLALSIQAIPQITLMTTVDMTQARATLDTQRAAGIVDVTFTHLILRAVARALRAHPNINTFWRAEGPWLRTLRQAHVGLAIAGDDTLVVATIAEPDRQELSSLVHTVTETTARGRIGALTQADLASAAITVSNLGMYRVNAFVAIVDPDQTAILAVGQVTEQAVVRNGGLYIVPQVTLALTIDHRVADGVAAARFLEAIGNDLERGTA
jgi:pyruvate dehydrogenase E2 component (dihydrolipoamide acetyltransferase)